MLKKILNNKIFQGFILVVILLNAVILGLETSKTITPGALSFLDFLDSICLWIFVVEILLKLIVFRFGFFKNSWNLFDFVIVSICLLPNTGAFSILRVFRIFRVLKVISSFERLRVIVASILYTLPSIAWVGVLLFVVFYIFGVIGTDLYGSSFPHWFGSVGESMYSLFQVMTLEAWSSQIARPVMAVYPNAYLYFVPFILSTSFVFLNVVIGIVCNAITNTEKSEKKLEEKKGSELKKDRYLEEIEGLKATLAEILKKLDEK